MTEAQHTTSGCPAEGTHSSRIYCILSYNGSTRDVIINYLMLVINLAACVRSAVAGSYQEHHHIKLQTNKQTDHPLNLQYHRRHRNLAAFCFVWIFQIGLCLLLAELSDEGIGCAGISIVWCAMAGWLWRESRPSSITTQAQATKEQSARATKNVITEESSLWPRRFLEWANTSVIVYYTVTEEVITTVAHLCALVLGALLEGWAHNHARPPA